MILSTSPVIQGSLVVHESKTVEPESDHVDEVTSISSFKRQYSMVPLDLIVQCNFYSSMRQINW